MNALLERTPNIIAAEINSIKDQTRKMILFNSIEIGRRLAEAKSMVPHGEWGKWLEESVDYSQSTANNLMRIFEEYGSQQISIFDNNAKSQALGNLSYTQAVALLSIPDGERESFIQEHDIQNMSTRELQQAIKEKQELEEKLKEAEKAVEQERFHYNTVSESYKRLEETNTKHYKEAERLRKELEQAKASGNDEEIERLRKELQAKEDQVKKLTEELNKPEIVDVSVIEKVPPEIEEELKQLRERTKELETKTLQKSDKAVLKFGVHFDTLVKCFNDLLAALAEIEDEEAKERYQKAVSGLITKMAERI